jgi:hypothetical protein
MNLPGGSAMPATGATPRVATTRATSVPAILARLAYRFVHRQIETVSALWSLRRGEFRENAARKHQR